MNFRTTYVLFAAALLTLLGVIIGLWLNSGSGGDGYLLETLHEKAFEAENVTRLEIQQTGAGQPETIQLERGDDGWTMTKPYEARVDQAVVNDIVRELLTAKLDPEASFTGGKQNLGLAAPTATVRLRAGDTNAWVKLGNVVFGDAESPVYVLTSDDDEPAAVQRRSIDSLFREFAANEVPDKGDAALYVRDVSDFRPLALLGSGILQPTEEVGAVTLTQGGRTVSIERRSDGEWVYAEPKGYGRVASVGSITPGTPLGGVRALLNAVVAIRATSRSAYTESPADLSEYGLDSGQEPLKITLRRREGSPKEQTLLVGKAVQGDAKKDLVYAKLEGDSAVAEVPDGNVKQLRQLLDSPGSMRDKTLVQLDPRRIDVITITGPSGDAELYRTGGEIPWTLFGGSGEGSKANLALVGEILTKLTQRNQISDFPEGKTEAEMGFDSPQATVKLWSGGIKPGAEPGTTPELTGDPAVTLTFGKRAADLVFVRRQAAGGTTNALVSGGFLDLVGKGRLDFLDPELPTFDFSKATKLSFTRGDQTFEVTKAANAPADPAEATWQIASPDNLKGRFADSATVSQILQGLSRLRPAKLIAEKPDEEALQRYGLTAAGATNTATVTLGGGESAETRGYMFGDSAGGGTLFAKLADNDLVFTVPPSAIRSLREAPIQDMTVLRFPATGVEAITMKGWQDVSLSLVTIELKLVKDAWVFSGNLEGTPDQQQVRTLLGAMNGLRAAEFVSLTGEVKPEYGLDSGKGALEISLKLKGKEEPVSLTVGGTDAAGSRYYAVTSELPKDVFLIPIDVFKPIKAKPAIFRK